MAKVNAFALSMKGIDIGIYIHLLFLGINVAFCAHPALVLYVNYKNKKQKRHKLSKIFI